MTTNQTIDGVSRDSVLQLIEFLADAKAYHKVVIGRCEDCIKSGESSEREEYWRIGYRTEKIEQVERLSEELRALLDAPAVENPIPQYFIQACDKFEWTPEEALRFYADGKHFDTGRGRTRILCTGAIASHALKSMGEGYAAMKWIEPAAQPQGDPVARWVDKFDAEYRLCPVVGNLQIQIREAGRPDKWVDVSMTPAHALTHLSPLHTEQPAPVAVALPERKAVSVGVLSESNTHNQGYNACLDEVTRLNSARPTHANPPPGTEPTGTHPHNDGLDEMRKP